MIEVLMNSDNYYRSLCKRQQQIIDTLSKAVEHLLISNNIVFEGVESLNKTVEIFDRVSDLQEGEVKKHKVLARRERIKKKFWKCASFVIGGAWALKDVVLPLVKPVL